MVSVTNTLLARLSKLVTTVTKSLADNIDRTREVKSCENLKADLVKFNARAREEALTQVLPPDAAEETNTSSDKPYINNHMPKLAISMDVKALYPSIKRERAATVTRLAMENTEVKFENIDYRMALRYISKSAKPAEILNWGLRNWCPVRKFRKGSRPGMTVDDPDDDKWTNGIIPSSEIARKKILGRVLDIAVRKVFSSNAYTFAGVM